ncbi:hypothetical protein PPYR_04045 [Photinus pyralis]|uniref:PHD-type domain-containing protein n=1 Tax=Photinus pyralis TaxID=7054 RepID=A0A5N4AWZ7_PHOPY|nr:hypothetical protein PPYR_04045 [Photinus pyralis]
MPTINKCFICNNALDSDREIKCDKCGNHIHSTCAGLSQSELKCFSNKNRKLAYHCDECNKENSEITLIPDNLFEDVVYEINQRQIRKRNLIVYGVPENNIIQQDRQQINETLSKLDPAINDPQFSTHRLGRFDHTNTRPRPIKVVLEEEQFVRNYVLKSSQLRSMPLYKHISLSFDRTPRQINYYRKIKKQLDERIAAGESNLKIKYIREVPTIVSLN